ncbi:hypothetical protein PIB30_093056, partial [Stylosanthes scabra]|nr:hypothetical protein [Stylosanthes scabra]
MPALAPPPATHTNVPASFTRSSPHPTRKELMRALRRNERIMRRHEQLLLMLHPSMTSSVATCRKLGCYTSGVTNDIKILQVFDWVFPGQSMKPQEQ